MSHQIDGHLVLPVLLVQPLPLIDDYGLYISELLRPHRIGVVLLEPSQPLVGRLAKASLIVGDELDASCSEQREGVLVSTDVLDKAVYEDDRQRRRGR